jgi:hypothetical protein
MASVKRVQTDHTLNPYSRYCPTASRVLPIAKHAPHQVSVKLVKMASLCKNKCAIDVQTANMTLTLSVSNVLKAVSCALRSQSAIRVSLATTL